MKKVKGDSNILDNRLLGQVVVKMLYQEEKEEKLKNNKDEKYIKLIKEKKYNINLKKMYN